jgi:hypothetical protein
MRADIHDGQEHKRSVQGPDTEAQDLSPPNHHFPLATRGRSIQKCQKRHMHRSKQHHYSITSSARARTAAPGRWPIGRSQGALRTLPEQTQRRTTPPPVVALVLACGRPAKPDCCTFTTATTNSTECTVVIHALYKVLPNRFCITQGKSRPREGASLPLLVRPQLSSVWPVVCALPLDLGGD